MEYAFKPTTNGRRVVAACGALEKQFRITRVAVGSGMVPEGVNLADVHELYQYVTEGAVSERRHENDRLYLTVQYDNSEHKEQPTFILSEFMVFVEDPETGEETDLLYAALGDYRQPVPAYNPAYPPSVFNYPMVIVVSDEIEVKIDAAPGLVTWEEFEEKMGETAQIEAEEPPTPETAGQPGQHYFDRKSKREYVCKGTTPDGEYIWEEVVTEDTVTRIVEEEIAKYPGGGYFGKYDLTLRPEDWKPAEQSIDGYKYMCDVEIEGVKSEHFPVGVSDPASESTAKKAGVRDGCETCDGYIRFLAKRKPEGDIFAAVALFGPGGSTPSPGPTGTPGAGLEYDSKGNLQVKAGSGITSTSRCLG